jgi:hypothetical protein
MNEDDCGIIIKTAEWFFKIIVVNYIPHLFMV